MKKNLLDILDAVIIIIAAVHRIIRRMYFKFSRHVLKHYFGIETPIYRKWHDRRAKRIQIALDAEHNI